MIGLGAEALASNIVRPSFPFKLTFAVTYNCDSRCATCGIWRKKSRGEMTLAEIREFFKINNGFRWVGITGGEPFLRKDLADICAALKESSPLATLTITTNSLRPETIVREARKIKKLGIERFILTLSCDGPGKVHDRIRGRKGNFEKLCKIYSTLRKEQDSHFKLFFGMTLSPLNVGEFEPLYRELHRRFPEIGYDKIHVNLFHSSEHFYGNRNLAGLWKEKAGKEIREIGKKRRFSPIDPMGFLEKKYLKGAEKFLVTGKSPIPCAACSSSIFLDPYGNVYPCTIWNRNLGKIADLRKAWNSPEFRTTAEMARKLECPNCWTPCEAYQSIAGNLLNPKLYN
jgi:MoaA/NifB/PqqE/SkfB family radical SAM enzyme